MSHCIMLIRHAEKPSADLGGVSETGAADPRSLSVAGWRRAGALTRYFASAAECTNGPIRRPRHILAAPPSGEHPSTRPTDTVRSVADVLGLTVDQRWSDQTSVHELARAVLGMDGPVLICWRHDQLPALARAILRDDRIPSAWPADRFDITWALFSSGDVWHFEQVPQCLLSGDVDQAITV